jgi:hypothetical protein
MSKLREAAQAVFECWRALESAPDNLVFPDYLTFNELIAELRDALREDALAEMQALTESEYRENTLVRLSETHQQLGAELGETENVRLFVKDYDDDREFNLWGELEFIGRSVGTYGGRWVLVAEDKAAVWPDGTAVYVRRVKK